MEAALIVTANLHGSCAPLLERCRLLRFSAPQESGLLLHHVNLQACLVAAMVVIADLHENCAPFSEGVSALQEAGLSSSVAREKWPVEALKKVVQDLGADIPPQLLERKLSHGARSAADWLQRQRAYARSAAVMSMVCGPP